PAPCRFRAGEEAALVGRLPGKPALPAYRPVRGLPRLAPGRTALVQNVETLAHLALIARYGAAWFRLAGTETEPGSMIATLHLADGRMSVAEAPLGTGLADLLGLDPVHHPGGAAGGGGPRPPAGARAGPVGVGVPPGPGPPAGGAARLPLANAALRPFGAAVGAGVVAALPAGRCGLAETARVARYLALESAGQCGPCFNGLPRIAAALDHLAGPRPDQRARADLERRAG